MKQPTNKIYFPGINAFRFFAASAVIITHIELLKPVFYFKSYWSNPVIFNLGGLGVYFFFVLSGFLITYLLLEEKKQTGKISVRQFYLRRILRIWPVFYLVAILGFFILPSIDSIVIPYLEKDFHEHFYFNLICYLLILPNLAYSFCSAVPHIGQSWSIGVEEQFYFFWPWLVKKAKNIQRSLIVFLVIFLLLKALIVLLPNSIHTHSLYNPIKRFFAMTKLESMAIGGLGAYWVYNKSQKLLTIIYNRLVLLFSVILIPILIFYTPDVIQDGIHVIYSLSFLIIIINVAASKNPYILENKFFNYLGNISYGVYMYHLMVIPFVLVFLKKTHAINDDLLGSFLIYILSFGITIFIASISYFSFEKHFMKLKKKFTKIESGS